MKQYSCRYYTIKLIELAEEGIISWETIARECLAYLSENEVKDIATSAFDLDEEDYEHEE